MLLHLIIPVKLQVCKDISLDEASIGLLVPLYSSLLQLQHRATICAIIQEQPLSQCPTPLALSTSLETMHDPRHHRTFHSLTPSRFGGGNLVHFICFNHLICMIRNLGNCELLSMLFLRTCAVSPFLLIKWTWNLNIAEKRFLCINEPWQFSINSRVCFNPVGVSALSALDSFPMPSVGF